MLITQLVKIFPEINIVNDLQRKHHQPIHRDLFIEIVNI